MTHVLSNLIIEKWNRTHETNAKFMYTRHQQGDRVPLSTNLAFYSDETYKLSIILKLHSL